MILQRVWKSVLMVNNLLWATMGITFNDVCIYNAGSIKYGAVSAQINNYRYFLVSEINQSRRLIIGSMR